MRRRAMVLGMVLMLVLIVLMALVGAGAALGVRRWSAQTDGVRASMMRAVDPAPCAAYDERDLDGLPAPVRRYFRNVLVHGQRMIATASIAQTGSFLVRESPARWGAFEATQLVTTRPPAFDWNARIAWLPGVRMNVRDAYVESEGILRAAAYGIGKLVDQRGTPELAEGELMRYLAEAPWYPTALLPGQGVSWQAIDDSTARATLTDGSITVSLTFHFSADGLIEGVSSEARYRDVRGTPVPTPWRGRFQRYEVHSRMRVPTEGEIAWVLPSGEMPYWRGRTMSIRYDFTDVP